jgi:hypothetical protein
MTNGPNVQIRAQRQVLLFVQPRICLLLLPRCLLGDLLFYQLPHVQSFLPKFRLPIERVSRLLFFLPLWQLALAVP